MDLTDNPLAAAADPATSHEAAGRLCRSGRRRRNAERVLALVRRLPGSTSVMLWHAQRDDPDAMDRHEVSRRLADLEHAALVRKCGERACAVKGTRMVGWSATAHGAAGAQGDLFAGVGEDRG